jgi:hypothetical protein
MSLGYGRSSSEEFEVDGYGFIEEIIEISGGYATGPERDLLTAMLFDCIQTFLSLESAEGSEARVKYRDALAWITRSDDYYIFSFNNVCDALGIDAEYLRIGLLNVRNSRLLRGKRRPKNL